MGRDIENLHTWQKEYALKNKERIRQNRRNSYYRNKDKILSDRKKYYEENRETILSNMTEYGKEKREKLRLDPKVIEDRAARKAARKTRMSEFMTLWNKERYKDHISVRTKDRIFEYNKRYYSKPEKVEARNAYTKVYAQHPEVKARRRQQEKLRRQNDPQVSIRQSLRCRIRSALRAQSTYKIETTEQLLGCSISYFKTYIESLFKPGMSWINRSDWHIDHKIPCKSFDLTDTEQQKVCFHYTNLQPLWKQENLSKGAKLQVSF